MTLHTTETMTRRKFVGGASGLVLAGSARGQSPGDEYGGYRMGLASFGFRNFRGPDAVAMTRSLGISIMELGPRHATFLGGGKRDRGIKPYHENPSAWAEIEQALQKHRVRVLGYGVVPFGGDADRNRKVFEWAKALGVESMSAVALPEAFDSLDGLVEEFGITVGMHNHGPQDKRYGKIEQVLDAVKDRHPSIGACVDVGHFWRAGEDPVEALERIGSRVHGCHLKDQVGAKEQAVVGEGALDIPAILKTLKKINYRGLLSLEYEDHPEDPVPYMARCLKNLRQMFAALS